MFRQSEVLIDETDYSQNEELANMNVEGSVTIKNVDMIDMNILDLFEKNVCVKNKIKTI